MTSVARTKSEPREVLFGLLRGEQRELENPRRVFKPSLRAKVEEACGILGYGYGSPLAEVKEHLRGAIEAHREVQKNRPSLEQLSTPQNGRYPDYSIGTSDVTLGFLYWALILREAELSRALATDTWDPSPPVVPEIFPIFRIAYAVRDVVLDRPDGILAQLALIEGKATPAELLQVGAIAAIIRHDRAAAAKSIDELSRVHQRDPRETLIQYKIVCIPAAGLASLALDRGLITPEDLPAGVDCFPRELVLDGRVN